MKNLFTIILRFADHAIIIEQYEEKTPLEALIRLIRHSDRLERYDRERIENALSHLHHSTVDRGVWTFVCNDISTLVLGGIIIQTDKSAYLRPHH